MKRTFGLAAGAFLFAVGCGGADAAEPPTSRTPFDQLGQEVEGDAPVSFLTPSTTGKLDGKAFKATLTITKFIAESGTVYALGTLSSVTDLPADAAAKLEGSAVKLPLSVQPEGGFPSDGSVPECQVLELFIAPTDKVESKAGALSLDRTLIDIATTPGGGSVVGQIVCGVPDLLTEKKGALAGIEGDFTTLISILNGLTGLPQDDIALPPSDDTGSDAAGDADAEPSAETDSDSGATEAP